jgi:hypothetical protein
MPNILRQLFEMREQRLTLQRQVDKMEQDEKDLMYTLTNSMVSDDVLTSTTDGFVAKRKTVNSPIVQDWAATLDYIKTTGQVDLLQKRLTESAVKARWDSGVDIPGVDKLVKHTVTITKA